MQAGRDFSKALLNDNTSKHLSTIQQGRNCASFGFNSRPATDIPSEINVRTVYLPFGVKQENNMNFENYAAPSKTDFLRPPKQVMFKSKDQQNLKSLSVQQLQNYDGERSKYFQRIPINNRNSYTSSNQGTSVVLGNSSFMDVDSGTESINIHTTTHMGKQVKIESNTKVISNRKKNLAEKFRVFTGTVDRVLRWRKMCIDFYFVEVIASVVSIQEGNLRQKIILLKDKRGPILQVVHYDSDRIEIENFYIGQMLRCVGHMIGPNILHGVSIRAATSNEVANLQRLCYICDHAVARSISNP